jgi:hypothetical protein
LSFRAAVKTEAGEAVAAHTYRHPGASEVAGDFMFWPARSRLRKWSVGGSSPTHSAALSAAVLPFRGCGRQPFRYTPDGQRRVGKGCP